MIALINSIVGGSKQKVEADVPKTSKIQAKDKEVGIVVNENPEIYLGTTIIVNPSLVNPFFLSIIIDGKVLRNCIIDSDASNNVIPIRIMEEMGLKVDRTYGKCYDMGSREVHVIGIIYKVPYKLVTFLEKELVMSVTVVNIPPMYGIILSRQWCASM